MIISVTQIKLKGIFKIIGFMLMVGKVQKQLKDANGLISARFRGFRTLTAWESIDAMNAFRNAGHHLDAMKKSGNLGKVDSVNWEAETEPSWEEALAKLESIQT